MPKIDKLLLDINAAFDSLLERKWGILMPLPSRMPSRAA